MPPKPLNPAITTYIERSAPFAVPILLHLRTLIHKAVPHVEESIKWSRPFFTLDGAILCNLSAFKHHCSLGFWGEEIAAVLREAGTLKPGAMGSLGKITALKDLPSDQTLTAWLKQAAVFMESSTSTSPKTNRVAKAPKPTLDPPEDFEQALAMNPKAQATFESFSPSCRREYLEWIASAKRPETRANRIAQATLMLAEGKQRNWKYQ